MKTQRKYENTITGIQFDEKGNMVKLKGVINSPSSLVIKDAKKLGKKYNLGKLKSIEVKEK
jgi:hypothetical protein